MKQKTHSFEDLIFLRIRMEIWLMIGLGILLLAYIFISGYGRVTELDRVLPATVMTGSGDILTAEVTVKGEYTTYPFGGVFGSGRDTFASEPGEGIFVGGKPFIYRIDYGRKEEAYFYGTRNDQPSFPAQYIAKRDCGELVIFTDVRFLFPDRESEPCLVVAPANSNAEARRSLENLPELYLLEDFEELLERILSA